MCNFDGNILNAILSGKNFSGEYMAAEIDTEWEKFEDSAFYVAFDRNLAKNLVMLSEEMKKNPTLFAIQLSASSLPGADAILLYDEPGADDMFEKMSEADIRERLDDWEKENDENPDDPKMETDVYIEVSRAGIGFIAQTESGNCEKYIELDDFKKAIKEVFEDTPAMHM